MPLPRKKNFLIDNLVQELRNWSALVREAIERGIHIEIQDLTICETAAHELERLQDAADALAAAARSGIGIDNAIERWDDYRGSSPQPLSQDDIVILLRQRALSWLDANDDLILDTRAAEEIDWLRQQNTILRKAAGEEGRANRMTLLHESAQTEIKLLSEKIQDLQMYAEQDACEIERLRSELAQVRSQLLDWR
jgi:hypothetical protein